MFSSSFSWVLLVLKRFIVSTFTMLSGGGELTLASGCEGKVSQDGEEAPFLSNGDSPHIGNRLIQRSLPDIFRRLSEPEIKAQEVKEYVMMNKSCIYMVTVRGKDTVLHRFVERIDESNPEHRDLLQFLLNQGAKASAKNESGDTPLHVAAREKKYNSIKFLIDSSEIDKYTILKEENQDGCTCLHVAVEKGRVEVVAILYLYKPYLDVGRKNREGFTAMDIASKTKFNDNKEAMEKICEILNSDLETHRKEFSKYLPGYSEGNPGCNLWQQPKKVFNTVVIGSGSAVVLDECIVNCNSLEDLKTS